MDFEEYRTGGHRRYAAFVDAIRHILGAAVDAHGLLPHAITGRAKDPGSLGRKLDDRGIDRGSAIDEVLKDLAGVRIVFLTNSAVNAFGQTGILHDNFEILNVNVHHPVPGTETETKLFDSTNYLVALKAERLALAEYASFAELRAEIQVQTLLNHAWAEMGHDTIYKQPRLDHVGKTKLAAIEARMDRVMRDYLLPAGHDFDKIARDFQRLLAADQGVPVALDTLAGSRDTDALYEAIGHLDDLILPQFDDPCPQFLTWVPTLIDAVERVRGAAAPEIETPFGRYPGKSGEDVARKAARLIADWRYCDPDQTLAALIRLYDGAAGEGERKIWVDLANEFASHNLDVWKRYGPAIPRIILDQVDRLGAEQRAASGDLLAPMLGCVLAPEIAGMTATSTTVTTQEALVAATEEVALLRRRATELLEAMLDAAPDDAARRRVLDRLRKAGTPPFNGANPALLAMVMADAARITAIERDRAAGWGLELRRQLELSLLRRHHRFATLPDFVTEHDPARAAQAALMEQIGALRTALAADVDLQLYKVMVGHELVRPDAWDHGLFDFEADRRWRTERHAAIIAGIDDAAMAEWIARVRLYVAEPRANDGHLAPMADWFRLLGEARPDLACAFLDEMDASLAPLLRGLLLGIDAGGGRERLRRVLARWMGEGRFLGEIADYLRWQDPFEIEMLEALTARSIGLGESDAVMNCVAASSARFEASLDQRLIDSVFLPAIACLDGAERSDWVEWHWSYSKALLAALDETQLQRVLSAIVGVAEIGYEHDMMLAGIAERFPALVLDFFEARIHRGRGENGLVYDAIPFSLDLLNGPLAAHPALLVATARRWYDLDTHLHEFRGGRLIHHVFPDLGDISEALGGLVREGGREAIAFVLATLIPYEGAPAIYPLCLDCVEQLDEGDALLSQVARVLGEKGVMTGEFGLVEADGEQRRRLEQYRDDPRPKVQTFIREYTRQIAQSMAWEQRRAIGDVEQRRRDWGEA